MAVSGTQYLCELLKTKHTVLLVDEYKDCKSLEV